jgi:hypothetical protein
MNKRIQELADEAWVYQVRVLNQPDGSRTYTEKEKVFDKEKFAMLIVRECTAIMHKDTSPNCPYVDYFKVTNEIKQHFGVEE